MYTRKNRSKRVRQALEANILHDARALETEEIDEKMFDYPMICGGNICEEVGRQVEGMLSACTGPGVFAENTDAGPNIRADDTDPRYIVLEKTEDDISIEIKEEKSEKIKFYNPMQSPTHFEREFYGDSHVLGNTMPFHFKEKGLAAEKMGRKAYTSKFPGALHLVIDSITGYGRKAGDTTGVSVRVDVNGKTSESAVYQEKKNIVVDFYVKAPVDEEGPVCIKIALIVRKAPSIFFRRHPVAVSECFFEFQSVDALQNRLIEMAGQWAPVHRTGIFKTVRRLFFHSEVPAGSVRLYGSYIASDEIPTINAPPPTTLYSLNKWLAVRKHAHNLLFAGYLTINYISLKNNNFLFCESGSLNPSPKKMYVKWYGFTIFLFDAFLKKLAGSINIADAELSCDDLEKGVLTFRIDECAVEVICDTTEKLHGCMEAMSLLFPKVPIFKS